jgi:hypothetical protein
VPEFFNQQFTLRVPNNGQCDPLAVFLLTNKHPTLYEDVFRYTVTGAEKLGVNVCPIIVYADIVTASQNAVTTVWPGYEVKSMWCPFRVELL